MQLFQPGLDDQPIPCGSGDHCMRKATAPSLRNDEADASAVPTCPSGATSVPIEADVPPCVPACMISSQSSQQLRQFPPAPPAAAEPNAAARPEAPDTPAQATMPPAVATVTQPAYNYTSQLPAYGVAPLGHAGCVYPPGMPNWAHFPQVMPQMVAMPTMMPMGWQAPLWMTYIPSSLQPRADAAGGGEAAEQRAQVRERQLARFHRKKGRLTRHRAVRYVSRKRYADSRPRVNGRFISKSTTAAAAAP